MNHLRINDVSLTGSNRLTCKYDVIGEWSKFFTDRREMSVEYSIPIENVTQSLLVIPFLSNVLPVAWLCDAEIMVDELDEDFYMHLDEIKQGYIDMYPCLSFEGGYQYTVN